MPAAPAPNLLLRAGSGAGYPHPVSSPELSVVCKNCGSEASPYVTECPYCGQRLRKRAPKLERSGDEIRVHEGRRDRRRRHKREKKLERAAERSPRSGGSERLAALRGTGIDQRPLVASAVLAISAVLLVVTRAVPLSLSDSGAIVGPVGDQIWRYLTAQFAYEDLGALIVVGAAIAIFGTAVERRIGSVLTAVLVVGSGALGALGADAVSTFVIDGGLVVAGGNGVALALIGAWVMLVRSSDTGELAEGADLLGAAAAAAVIVLLPLVEVTADPVAGILGGLLGIAFGWMATRHGGVTELP